MKTKQKQQKQGIPFAPLHPLVKPPKPADRREVSFSSLVAGANLTAVYPVRINYFPFFGTTFAEAFDTAAKGDLLSAAKICPVQFLKHNCLSDAFPGVPVWNGEPIPPGKVLFLTDTTGYGDSFHFIRYLSLLRERLGDTRIELASRRQIVPLLRSICDRYNIALYTIEEQERTLPQAQALSGMWGGLSRCTITLPPGGTASIGAYTDIAHLPFLFGFLPSDSPYLAPQAETHAAFREATKQQTVPGRLRVGLCYIAGQPVLRKSDISLHPCEDRRVPAELYQQLVSRFRRDVHFFMLQPTKGKNENFPPLNGAFASGDIFRDWDDTAALVAEMDLIISVDTGLCHLAGAMHKEVWTLLPSSPCWRWGTDPDRSDWYPTMRLFRQQKPGDWNGVMAKVTEALRERIAA